MASFGAGICPKCNEHLLIKQGLVFLICPLCASNIGAREANDALNKLYCDPAQLTEYIATVIRLEKKYGPQLPYQILLVLKKNFPHNEEVAFLTLKFGGYNTFALKEYLTNFAKFKKTVSFASEVLEKGLIPRNWELAQLFEQFIKNKTEGTVQVRWLDALREMNASIAANPMKNTANTLLYCFYIVGTVLNVLLAAIFIVFSIKFAFSVIIAVSLLTVEMVILYGYAKKYGGRLTILDTERLLMVIFMCSIVVAVGGVFLGALIKIL
jgi:hypothetical protein